MDDQGGIVVKVSKPLPNYYGGIPPGIAHMDGATALCYVHEIRNSNEFERNRRMLEFLKVCYKKVLDLIILNICLIGIECTNRQSNQTWGYLT